MATAGEIELEFYERFFLARGIEPYPVQERALDLIFKGESVLVTVPTGTGKTIIAKAAIWKALQNGQRAIYTTPLRALTEEKFRELEADFGADKVGFKTGDYQVRPDAPVQVEVAEILWNRIYGDRVKQLAEVVVMDEGHYFNDPERGYVWEQSIIGLDPRSQLIILSATVGEPQQFCNWVYSARRVELQLVESHERKVPLHHEYRETYLIDLVKELHAAGDTPTIIFVFGREQCFDKARLLKSCARFTTDEERARAAALADQALLDRGVARDLRPLLLHGIGIHHAGILPRYKRLVEQLALEKLIKFVVSTETISAGINLPARRVVFPELRKHIQGQARILTSAEYHQMAGRAGRPQFDTEGIAITLAPEEVVQFIRKETKDARKGGFSVDEEKIRRAAYAKARADAQRNQEVTWDLDTQRRLVSGQPAGLKSQTRITTEQILAIGLPDLEHAKLEEEESEPAYMNLNIKTVIDHLLLSERDRVAAHRRLAQATENLRALGIVDEHGAQVTGQVINRLRGIDGLFVHYFLAHADPVYAICRELVEYLVDHQVIHKILSRKGEDEKREWMRNKLREMRHENPQASWEDAEAEYEKEFPRELTAVEKVHAEFVGQLPHPELHGGKVAKRIWADMEEAQLGFMDFVERESLQTEEGNLFSYLARVMRTARMLREATTLPEFAALEENVRRVLGIVDERVLSE